MKHSFAIFISILCLLCACTKAEDGNYLKIDRKHLIKQYECEGGTESVLVDANVPFKCRCTDDWVEAKIAGPQLILSVKPLRDCPDRETVLTVEGNGVNPVNISISQTAVTVNNPPSAFVVSDDMPAMAIDLTSGVELEFILPDWIKAVDDVFEYGQKVYTFTALPITGGPGTRTGEFKVKSKDENVGFELVIPVSQSGGSESILNEATLNLRQLWTTDPMGMMTASNSDERYVLLKKMQAYSDAFNRDPFQSYLKASESEATKIEEDNPIMSCYRYAFDMVFNEIVSLKVEEGSAVIWMLYNMGFIIKTSEVCVGIDVNHYYAEKLAPYLDAIFISHADSDHKDDKLNDAMHALGKPVVSNFYAKSSYMSTIPKEFEVAGIQVYTSITDHDASKPNYTTCHFLQFGAEAGNFSFMHVGDSSFSSSQYKEMTGRNPNLLILRYAQEVESGIVGTGTGKVQPDYIFLSHLIELRHYIEKSPMRATIPGAWKNNEKYFGKKAKMPFWGERFLWKDGSLTTYFRDNIQ